MTRRIRLIIFLFLLVLFLIAAPLTVLYCLGWRFDWEAKKISQPGALYFKVVPKNVEIYLNGKFEEKTDFFFGSALIENLFPGKYEVEIKKEGFNNWKKVLQVKEREVTEAKNIVLIPKDPKFNLLSKGVEDFFFSPDGKKIILKEKSGNGWSLKLFEIEKNLKSHLIDEKTISRTGVELISLKFSPDSKKILLELGLKENINSYLLDLQATPPTPTLVDLNPAEKIYFNSEAPQGLAVIEENAIAWIATSKDIYYLDKDGFLFKANFSLNRRDRLNIIPFNMKQETEYQIIPVNSKVLLKENDALYFFDENKKSFEKISDSIEGFRTSFDFKKLAYFNNYEILTLFLEKIWDQPQKEAGDKTFLTRFSEKIGDVFWLNNHYLIFNVENKIKVAEIDDRDRINIVDLAEFKEPKLFWNQNAKKLYILSEQNLYVSGELTP